MLTMRKRRITGKTEKKVDKGSFDKVIIGNKQPDEALFMGDKLKDLKFSAENIGATKRAIIEGAMITAGAGLFGMVGYEAGAVVGGPLAILTLTAAAAFIGGTTAQQLADRVL